MSLASKLIAIGGTFFAVAMASIALTLWVTWQLVGGAAAVNEAGRMRMRGYELALTLTQPHPAERAVLVAAVDKRLTEFDESLALLEEGDAVRPLFVPWDSASRQQFARVQQDWVDLQDKARQIARGVRPPDAFPRDVDEFVAHIDGLVSAIERHLARWTGVLHSVQVGMLVLAILSSLALFYALRSLVLEPLARLQQALGRMELGEFSTRVKVTSRDELGALGDGFNAMAARLESLYLNLEQKVREKTAGLEERQQRLSALYEVAAFVATTNQLDDLAQGFARQLRRIARADAVAIRWSNEANERYVLLASDCLPQVMAQEEQCVLSGDCLCGSKAPAGTPPVLRVIPIMEASRALHEQTGRQMHEHCEKAGYTTLVTVPLGLHQRLLGEVELFYRGMPVISDEERGLFEALASHLASAMESLRAVAMGREAAIANERQLLAQELHDSIAQSLAFLKIQMQLLRDGMERQDRPAVEAAMKELDEGVRESYADVRELLLHFRVRTHTDDIEPALRETLSKFEHQAHLRSTLHIHGHGLPLPPDVQIQVLHIVQEALSNVRKHAQATQVWVDVHTQPSWRVSVRDDGQGFDLRSGPPDDTHVGLRIMRERAQRIGGELVFQSTPQDGTCVELRLPPLTASKVPGALYPEPTST
jgi:two-component system nitrate/nitrite sensor histidine kinase NarX